MARPRAAAARSASCRQAGGAGPRSDPVLGVATEEEGTAHGVELDSPPRNVCLEHRVGNAAIRQSSQRFPGSRLAAEMHHVLGSRGVHVAPFHPDPHLSGFLGPGQGLGRGIRARDQLGLWSREPRAGQQGQHPRAVAGLDGPRLVYHRHARSRQPSHRLEGFGALAHGEHQPCAGERLARRVGWQDPNPCAGRLASLGSFLQDRAVRLEESAGRVGRLTRYADQEREIRPVHASLRRSSAAARSSGRSTSTTDSERLGPKPQSQSDQAREEIAQSPEPLGQGRRGEGPFG